MVDQQQPDPPQREALRRLLLDAAQGGQARVDALVALSQRNVIVVPWPTGIDGYRTLVNSQRSAALPIFTERAELEQAGRRFGWFAPDGTIPGVEIGARAAFSYAKAQNLGFVVVDIAADHCLELAREEFEPLLTATGRRQTGPFAIAGTMGSSLHHSVRAPSNSSIPQASPAVQMGVAARATGQNPVVQRATGQNPMVERATGQNPLVSTNPGAQQLQRTTGQMGTMVRTTNPGMQAQVQVPIGGRASSPQLPPATPHRATGPQVPTALFGSTPNAPAFRAGTSQPNLPIAPSAERMRSEPMSSSEMIRSDELALAGPSVEGEARSASHPTFAAVNENDVPTLRSGTTSGSALPSVELKPPLAPPSDAMLDKLEDLFRAYPEIEWACIGMLDQDVACGLRVDSKVRARVQEIAVQIAATTAPKPFVTVLLDSPLHMRKARAETLVFYPWRRK